jgi:Arc/MetJ-type ribon-helix-helix transcriptional regulator
VVAQAKLKPSSDIEKLQYFLMLRQFETQSEVIRAAYQRLADTASASTGWNVRTVILDWLEAELRVLRRSPEDTKPVASELMKAAVSLSNALKQ